MDLLELIIKKRDQKKLSSEEIDLFVREAIYGADYQVSAMLMAIYLNGIDSEETYSLTKAMARSGRRLDLSAIRGIKVDKHSTGGIGDTTTLVLAPLVAACGLPVVKMSGRGLGFTGGTADKLESVGIKMDLGLDEALELAKEHGFVLMSQSGEITPADRALYHLRDVTGTVESLPLIASSIMSKKIASGCDAVVLDVKCGRGGFAKDLDSARALAQMMIDIGADAGMKVTALITSMDQPLGTCIGNALEVREALDILQGRAAGRLLELSLLLGAHMLIHAGLAENIEDGRVILKQKIDNQEGYGQFMSLYRRQRMNPDAEFTIPEAPVQMLLTAPVDGLLCSAEADKIGLAAAKTGAGRVRKDDVIDPSAGIVLRKMPGDHVCKGEVMAEVHGNCNEKCNDALNILREAFCISDKIIKEAPLVLAELKTEKAWE